MFFDIIHQDVRKSGLAIFHFILFRFITLQYTALGALVATFDSTRRYWRRNRISVNHLAQVDDIWYFLPDAQIIGYFAALLAVARAGIIGPGAAAVAVAQQPAAAVIRAENYDSHPQYSFGYSVADGLTGTFH